MDDFSLIQFGNSFASGLPSQALVGLELLDQFMPGLTKASQVLSCLSCYESD